MMISVLLPTILFFFLGSGQVQQQSELCSHPELLIDKQGKPVRLGIKETESRIIACSLATLSDGAYDGKGNIMVQLLISTDGKVVCAKAMNGPEEMRKMALEAVKEWSFKPFEKEGKRGAVYGLAMVRISWDQSWGYDSCENVKKRQQSAR